MKRIVTVCRAADRHADPHQRRFAETRLATVDDGPLRDVVDRALADTGFEDGGRFVIQVEEPHE